MNAVYNEDCLHTMDFMPSNHLDLTLTSWPYGKLRRYTGYTFNSQKITRELFRVTAIGGMVILVINDQVIKGSETGDSLRYALYFLECGFKLYDTIIWNKDHVFGGCGNPPKRYAQVWEYVFCFSKGDPKTFNPIKIKTLHAGRVHTLEKKKDRRKEEFDKPVYVQRTYTDSPEKISGNIFTHLTGWNKTTTDKIAFKHPAIFPDSLAEDLILSFSNEGDLVYDPCAGSGTTPKMAKKNNRRYKASEISKDYCDIINHRLLLL